VIWWADVVDDEDLARTYYAKLGYSVGRLRVSSPRPESSVQPVAD